MAGSPSRESSHFDQDPFFSNMEISWLKKCPKCIVRVRDQKRAVACYAFTAVDCVFAQYYLEGKYGTRIGSLSPQELVDCIHEKLSPTYNKEKWEHIITDPSRGYPSSVNKAFKYIQKFGIFTDKLYPYEGVKQACKRLPGPTHKLFISGFKELETKDEIIERLGHQPLAGCVPYVKSFVDYETGVYLGPTVHERQERQRAAEQGRPLLYHSLQIVGLGEEGGHKCYLCKNSWGPDWGHKGYVKVVCDLVERVSYPYGGVIKKRVD